MSTPDAVIDIAGLACRIDGKALVDQVSLHLEPGGIVGLVGANGGGKTTTLRMIAGLLRPSSGSGMVLGHDVLLSRRPKGQLGYMTQALALYPELTVRENLEFRASIGSAAKPSLVAAAQHYGLTSVLDQRVSILSGGWARRVQFAASVLRRPALLLLDEPTAGLDALTRHDMWSWIEELAAGGCAVVVATHDLAEAERCPAILHYHGGLAEGSLRPFDLMQRYGVASLEAAIMAGGRT